MGGDMNYITDLLPEGWKEKARELKAFQRAGDYLKTPEDLLRVVLLWADLGTLGHTAAFLKITGEFPMSKVALYQRIEKSAAWLEWLTVHFRREHEYLMECPRWLKNYRVTLVDGTRVMGKELYTLHMREYEVVYDALTYLLLESFHAEAVFSSLQKLPAACASLLTLYSFSIQISFQI